MAKMPSTFLNMVVTLFVVTLISSAALGTVYELTKGPLAQAAVLKKQQAIAQVVPAFDNQPVNDQYQVCEDDDCLTLYPARMGENLVGTAIETVTRKGHGGEIRLMVGLLPDGSIQDTVVLDHKETPGLGDKMDRAKSNFPAQFQGKMVPPFRLAVKKDGGDVDAITAATISSRAFCEAVDRAVQAYHKRGEGR